jgi:hypothetical protein
VADLTVQPTAKFLKAGTILAALVFLGLEIAYLTQWRDQAPQWVMAIPPLILLWPLARWTKRSASKATITSDRLRYVRKTTVLLSDRRGSDQYQSTNPSIPWR